MRDVLLLFLIALPLAPGSVEAGQPCDIVPIPCTFEAPPFKLTVVDAKTRMALADVHALAEWESIGSAGRGTGPLMALDATSVRDGSLNFPGWGPISGSGAGLGIGHDPVITLFKSGYKALVINNGDLPGMRETERVRGFRQAGRTYALEPFRGTPAEWLTQLDKLWGLPRSDLQTLQFRDVYSNRMKRLSAERSKCPPDEQRVGRFFWHLDRELMFLEEGHR